MKNFQFWLLLLFPILLSCENEPIGKPDPAALVAVNSELFQLVQKAAGNDFENGITCIDFNYPFTIIIYNEELDEIGRQLISRDLEFSEFLGNLEAGKLISLSYPITSILDNGEPYEINNNQELKEAIDKCIAAETIASCINILTETSYIWQVNFRSGTNGQYEGSQFMVSNLGNAGLNFQNDAFFGAWTTYFIEDELHLNIFITGDEQVAEDWNFDWKVVRFNDTQMLIDNGVDRFLLLKDCGEPCVKFIFEECELEPGSGKAIFDLDAYSECLFPLTNIDDPATATLSYYTTYEDLLAGTNPIVDLQYENVVNPQIIYVRFDDIETGEMLDNIPIILKAEIC